MLRLRATSLVAAAVAAALVLNRPALGQPASWTGDQAAVAGAWTVALVCSAYLAIVTGVCVVATHTHRRGLARGAARFAPRFVRSLVEVALVGALSVSPAIPAFAAGPVVTADQPVVRSVPDTPVVRTRPAPGPTTTTAPRHASATPTSAPRPDAPAPAPTRPAPPVPASEPSARRPPPQPHATRPPATGRTHVVRRGDNLWTIARHELQRRGTAEPGDAATARYLERVVSANIATLRSGNPNLIYPGEVVALPEPA